MNGTESALSGPPRGRTTSRLSTITRAAKSGENNGSNSNTSRTDASWQDVAERVLVVPVEMTTALQVINQ